MLNQADYSCFEDEEFEMATVHNLLESLLLTAPDKVVAVTVNLLIVDDEHADRNLKNFIRGYPTLDVVSFQNLVHIAREEIKQGKRDSYFKLYKLVQLTIRS